MPYCAQKRAVFERSVEGELVGGGPRGDGADPSEGLQFRDGPGHRRHLALKAREMRGAFLRVRVEEELYVVIRERREQVPLDRGEREVEAAIYTPEADGDAPSRGRGDRS